MKIIIILEECGGYCNRLFQSLHFHAYSLEKGIIFFNPSMIGLLKFDNSFFYFLDRFKNLLLKIFSKAIVFLLRNKEICFYFKDNYIKILKGWDYRNYKSTIKFHKTLSKMYGFDRETLSGKYIDLIKFLDDLKKDGRFIVVLHIRRKDYKSWNNGKFYFSNKFYKKAISDLKIKLQNNQLDPFIAIVSDEKIDPKIGADFISNGSWKYDQILLQNCELIVGPQALLQCGLHISHKFHCLN